MNVRSRPSALCSSCGAYSYDAEVINTMCNAAMDNNGKCDGFWQDRTRVSDWETCSRCMGSGYINSKRCAQCNHSGWVSRR